MVLASAAAIAALGTFPGGGGLYDQPAVLVEAMTVLGSVDSEAERIAWENDPNG